MKKNLILVLLTVWCSLVFSQNIGIGKWRNHFSYTKIYKTVVAGSRVYAQADLGLCYYDEDDGTLNKLSKIEGLSDVGISTIAYDAETRCLVVAYKNSNVDLVVNDKVVNLSDIKRKEIAGDKYIYNISFSNRKAYLSCGFGVVVVDLDRKEIADVYYLGDNGGYLKVNDVAFVGSKTFAATDLGLLWVASDEPFPNIAENWTKDTLSAVAGKVVRSLEVADGKLFAHLVDNDSTASVYVQNEHGDYSKWLDGNIKSIEVSNGNIVVCRYLDIAIYDESMDLKATVEAANYGWWEMKALHATVGNDNSLWVAHEWAGMICYPSYYKNEILPIMPSGPESDDVYNLVGYKNGVLLSPGGRRGDYYVKANVAHFQNNEWRNLEGNTVKDTAWNVLDVVPKPGGKEGMWAASWRNGVLEIDDHTVVNLYNEDNTNGVLETYTLGDYRSLRIGACAVDNYGNVWFTNSLAKNGLVTRKRDGTWEAFNTQQLVIDEIYRLVVDSVYNYKWFLGTANRIYVHDGKERMAYVDPNNGSKLESSLVNCLVQDHTGELWIGTDKGVKVIYNPGSVFKNGGQGEMSPIACSNILYTEDDKVEYLLAYENITCIAVDGANRKWIGTASGGVFLISENGLEQLLHFNEQNSPLPSNKINAIGIAPETGEVFIGTDAGTVSYRSTATYAEAAPQEEIYAYPNPVHPDYSGDIAIKGFTRDAIVHITDAAGKVVFSTKALGGQAVWNGKTNTGQRVSTGVYFVFASDKYGKNKSVAKILFIK